MHKRGCPMALMKNKQEVVTHIRDACGESQFIIFDHNPHSIGPYPFGQSKQFGFEEVLGPIRITT